MSTIRTPVQRVLSTFRTEHAIHGTVLVSAVIAVGWNDDTDLEVLLFVLGSVGVFWLAHVYSGILAREGDREPRLRAVLVAARRSMSHTTGLIASMVLPLAFLLLAVVGVLDEYVAYYAALWVGVAVLAVLGYAASARRGSPWYLRLLSAVVTSSLGLLIIWLSSLVR